MNFFLTHNTTFSILNNMYYATPITVRRILKAAWHISAVAEEAFY